MADAKQIFLEALEFASQQDRANYLEQACAGDAALRGRVDDLLRAHRQAGSFLGGAWQAEAETRDSIGETPGTFVGPYRLLEQIGEGGFGVVFLAEQQQPVRRRVALKVVKPGMDTREVIARFEVERQALAIMDHPNIAKVLDAGATTSGRPYFVMELVRGVAITAYCDQHSLTPYERLELFITVCHAVQHAHQKGIIHRDIKPSNVLVASHDGRPVVKVIDFGVAKAIGGQLGDHTVYTRFTQMIGTPLYMSPEQAELSGLDIDTRTDIYSLGVLLYELLTGVTPFDRQRMNQAGLDEIRRIIREEEPPKPSTRLSDSGESLPSIAACRQTEPARLTKLVRGDLDWIVMKALEKDRRRRYETANGLASDVRRYLLDEPVSAAAPSRVYRIRKFVARNKFVAAASAAVIGALAVGLVGTTIGLIGQSRQRKIADDAREQLEAVNNFLMYDLFAGVEVNRTTNKAVRDEIVKVMIDPAAARVGEQFAGKPLVEAKVRYALAMSYDNVGRRDLALPHARSAHAISLRELGTEHPDTLIAAQLLGELLQANGEYAEAEPLLRDSLAVLREQEGEGDEVTVAAINNLASLHLARGEFGAAEELFREAIELGRKVLSEDDEHVLLMMNNLAFLLRERGETEESEALLRDSLERCRRVLSENHRVTLQAISNLGAVLREQGRLADAEPFWLEGMERCSDLLGPDDPETLIAVNDYAGLLMEENKLEEAEPLIRDTLERRRRVLPKDHHDTLVSIGNMGIFLRRKRDLPAAEPYCREAFEGFQRVHGDNHPDTLIAAESLVSLLMSQDKINEAEPYLEDACRRAPLVLPEEHPLQATLLYSLGTLRFRQEKLDEAESLLQQALERRERYLGGDHFDTLYVRDAIGTLRRDQGRLDEAEEIFRQVQAGYRRAFKDPDHPQIAGTHMDIGIVLTKKKRFPEAKAELIEAARIYSAAPEPNAGPFGHCLESLVTLHREWDKAEPDQGHMEKAQTWQAKRDEFFYPIAPTDASAAK